MGRPQTLRLLTRFLPEQGSYAYRRLWSWLNWGFLGMVFVPFMAVFFTYNWQDGPLNWRVFQQGGTAVVQGAANHHTLIMVVLGVSGLVLLLKGVKPVLAFMGVFFAGQMHEVWWWAAFIVSRYLFGRPLEWWWFQVAGGAVASLVFWAVVVKRWPWRFMAWLTVWYVAWVAVGFPISVDFTGNVQGLYVDPWVNGFWEIGGWVWAMAGFSLDAGALARLSRKLDGWVKVN